MILFIPTAVLAQDNVHFMSVDNNEAMQPNLQPNHPNSDLDDIKGIPVAVSFPKGDYQW